jgi:hypothetical protein
MDIQGKFHVYKAGKSKPILNEQYATDSNILNSRNVGSTDSKHLQCMNEADPLQLQLVRLLHVGRGYCTNTHTAEEQSQSKRNKCRLHINNGGEY